MGVPSPCHRLTQTAVCARVCDQIDSFIGRPFSVSMMNDEWAMKPSRRHTLGCAAAPTRLPMSGLPWRHVWSSCLPYGMIMIGTFPLVWSQISKVLRESLISGIDPKEGRRRSRRQVSILGRLTWCVGKGAWLRSGHPPLCILKKLCHGKLIIPCINMCVGTQNGNRIHTRAHGCSTSVLMFALGQLDELIDLSLRFG